MASSECNKLANGEVMRSAAGEMGWGYRTQRNGGKHVIQHNTTLHIVYFLGRVNVKLIHE